MVEASQAEWATIHRDRPAQLRSAHLLGRFDNSGGWHVQGHGFSLRLPAECQRNNRPWNERWVGNPAALGNSGLIDLAVECGPVTSLAISEDGTTVASGHQEGHIFTWELGKSAKPFLHIPPLEGQQRQTRRADGHLSGVSIIHVGFLGFRHTALVSADDRGMAFSHLATRGMGSVGRTVKITRILGRYPDVIQRPTKTRKASSVLAFASLPFGNVEQKINSLGLVAMMTPYLLVIVSTTPIAQTQHKAARPKEIAAHSAMTAALAWFPAIKLKAQHAPVSKPKIVYCWSNVLTVLEVDEVPPAEPLEKEKPLELTFRAARRWRAPEPIVAIQWISRSVMAILTLTQQLIILEDHSMTPTGSFDLVQRHIFHNDLFSQQLHALVEQLDEEDPSMHGVVADAFYMSFRAYKGRLFVLGQSDLSIGSLSNWADRLLAMLEAGDFIGAIRLATSYYSGEGERVTIGLPEEDALRHAAVREKLDEMVIASLKYAFGQNQKAETDRLDDAQLVELANACVTACLTTGATDFLFDEVFAWYDDNDKAKLILDIFEPHILDGTLTSLPPVALKPLIEHYITNHSSADLEEIICRLDTSSMDIDQVTTLCKANNLYDAYIYVWTNALRDFIGPVDELLNAWRNASHVNGDLQKFHSREPSSQAEVNAEKVFPYLSFTLTGRVYPTGDAAEVELSQNAKYQIYEYFFSGAALHTTSRTSEKQASASYAHLRDLLVMDTASSMSLLNEAFEDHFLNKSDEVDDLDAAEPADNPSATIFTRQLIVTILLEHFASDTSLEDGIFVDMFVARSLAKYPQDIVLSGSTLDQLLSRLSQSEEEDLAEDCQLSVEYLLSAYHPPSIQSFVPFFQKSRFYHVLKSVFRVEKQWPELVETFLVDEEDQTGVFDVIRDSLRPSASVNPAQQQRVRDLFQSKALQFAQIDVQRTAQLVEEVMPDSHNAFLSALDGDSHEQYRYLNSLLEDPSRNAAISQEAISLTQRYIQLMCEHDPSRVADYVNSSGSLNLQLEKTLPFMEATGTIDAAVILMARQGHVNNAMVRLLKQLNTLETALSGIIRNLASSPDLQSTSETIRDLVASVKKYVGVGIWLCQTQTKAIKHGRGASKTVRRSSSAAQPLTFEENLWLQLINSSVRIARNSSLIESGKESPELVPDLDKEIIYPLREVIQDVFTALLKATSTAREQAHDRHNFAFLNILRAFLRQAAASLPSLAELRDVISVIFSAYAYEKSLLALANSMLDKDVFVHVDEIARLRQRGWRPRGQVCEVCRRRVWGPGAGSHIWEAWVRKEKEREARRSETGSDLEGEGAEVTRGKGKATAEAPSSVSDTAMKEETGSTQLADPSFGPVVVFACRHLFHEWCLDNHRGKSAAKGDGMAAGESLDRICPVCNDTL